LFLLLLLLLLVLVLEVLVVVLVAVVLLVIVAVMVVEPVPMPHLLNLLRAPTLPCTRVRARQGIEPRGQTGDKAHDEDPLSSGG